MRGGDPAPRGAPGLWAEPDMPGPPVLLHELECSLKVQAQWAGNPNLSETWGMAGQQINQ